MVQVQVVDFRLLVRVRKEMHRHKPLHIDDGPLAITVKGDAGYTPL
jgi:hypothetical protein